jgi:hypothetical protein
MLKNKFVIVLATILINISAFSQKHTDPGFIKMFYAGDISKPYSRFLFYVKGSNEAATDTICNYKIEISTDIFQKLAKKITQIREYARRDSAFATGNKFQFEILIFGEKTIFLTPYFWRVKSVVDYIKSELTYLKNNSLHSELDYMLQRLIYDNSLDKSKNR